MTSDALPIVFVVDDDAGMRQALRRLFKDNGLVVEAYASAQQFLDAYCAGADAGRSGCLVLDLMMPGMNGLELQATLGERGVRLPIVFLTGSSRVCDAVAAMKAGAVDFLEKPFEPAELLGRVRKILEAGCRIEPAGGETGLQRDLERRFALLTAREKEVMQLMVAGQTSKEIARLLGGSHRTVEIHRGRVMQKMEAGSLADLVRMSFAVVPASLPAQ